MLLKPAPTLLSTLKTPTRSVISPLSRLDAPIPGHDSRISQGAQASDAEGSGEGDVAHAPMPNPKMFILWILGGVSTTSIITVPNVKTFSLLEAMVAKNYQTTYS